MRWSNSRDSSPLFQTKEFNQEIYSGATEHEDQGRYAVDPMTGTKSSSCFVSKLSHFVALTDDERHAVADFERSERKLAAHEVLYQEGEPATELYVVKSGWLCSIRYTETGQRQILQLRHPGDLCGMHDQMLRCRSHSLMALEESVICPLPLTNLPRLMKAAPRVSLLLNALTALDQVLLFDLIQAITRTSASERVLYLLLHLLHRLKLNNPDMDKTFRLPMTQSLIGDLLGLTNVTVSKSMSELEKDKLVQRNRGTVTIVDIDKCVKRTCFTDRYSNLDLDWLD